MALISQTSWSVFSCGSDNPHLLWWATSKRYIYRFGYNGMTGTHCVFLWLDKDHIVEYRMTSHLFGGVWCSSSSTFALRQTVCNLPDHGLIKDTVLRAFYVDDLWKSVQSAEEVTRVVNKTLQVIGHRGFKLTKFVLNDKQLLETVDVDDRASEVRSVVPDMCSRALGIQWHVNEDSFRYVNKREQIDDATAITRRHILSCVSSMYDPLGQISPIVLTGKMIF